MFRNPTVVVRNVFLVVRPVFKGFFKVYLKMYIQKIVSLIKKMRRKKDYD